MAEYSFDTVCKVDRQELANALDTARKEITNRFDFKGSHVKIEIVAEKLLIEAADDMKIKQLIDIVQAKLVRRNISLKAFPFAPFVTNVSGIVKSEAPIQNGLSQEQCKKITRLIKDSKIKVQSRIQSDTVRISGKSKNDLQTVQKIIEDANFDFATSFENYR